MTTGKPNSGVLQTEEVEIHSSKNSCCPICYEELRYDEESAVGVTRLRSCNHAFCSDCLKSHCEVFISKVKSNTAKFAAIPCPRHAELCEGTLSETEVQQALLAGQNQKLTESKDQETNLIANSNIDYENTHNNNNNASWLLWKRYCRAIQLFQDPTLMLCPRCGEIVRPADSPGNQSSTNSSDETNNAITCLECRHVFCAVHGDSHDITRVSCREFEELERQSKDSLSRFRGKQESKMARQTKKSELALEKYTRPCSRCGCRIYKESGCDHVICLACGEDMCFKCGTHEYLTGRSVRTCQKCRQGYLDHRYDRIHRCRMLCLLPFMVPFYLLYMVFMTVVAVASFGFCCCCCCSADDNNRHQERAPLTPSRVLRAIQLGVYVIILPLLFVLADLGFHIPFVEEMHQGAALAGSEQKMPDFPIMTVDDGDSDGDLAHVADQKEFQKEIGTDTVATSHDNDICPLEGEEEA